MLDAPGLDLTITDLECLEELEQLSFVLLHLTFDQGLLL